MTTQLEILRQQKIAKAREAFQRAKALRNSRRALGVDGIYQHVEDVDGDWLEKWSDEQDIPLDNRISAVGGV